jgi:hypothetical protein
MDSEKLYHRAILRKGFRAGFIVIMHEMSAAFLPFFVIPLIAAGPVPLL